MPAQKPYTFAIHMSQHLTENSQRVCLCQRSANLKTL